MKPAADLIREAHEAIDRLAREVQQYLLGRDAELALLEKRLDIARAALDAAVEAAKQEARVDMHVQNCVCHTEEEHMLVSIFGEAEEETFSHRCGGGVHTGKHPHLDPRCEFARALPLNPLAKESK